MKIAICTDVHLDHMKKKHARHFLKRLAEEKPDAVVCCGDMSCAVELSIHLEWVQAILGGIHFYFVCGNHDFYGGSIEGVRASLGNLPGEAMTYLTQSPPVQLAPDITLIGHDGWYDGGYADWFKSRLILTDYAAIAEFRHQSHIETKLLIERLASQGAEKIKNASASLTSKHVIIATHVPPFSVCSLGPDRRPSDADWMPVMSSKRMGDAILTVAAAHPETEFTVLSGHTHTPCTARVAENVECIVGDADATGQSSYGHPMWTMLEIR
jgi:predicted phosphodiesterase